MVRLGIKFVKCVFDSLRPGQSQRQLRDGIIHLLLDGSEFKNRIATNLSIRNCPMPYVPALGLMHYWQSINLHFQTARQKNAKIDYQNFFKWRKPYCEEETLLCNPF